MLPIAWSTRHTLHGLYKVLHSTFLTSSFISLFWGQYLSQIPPSTHLKIKYNLFLKTGLFSMCDCFACTRVHHTLSQSGRPERALDPGAGGTDGHKTRCKCKEPNLGLLQKQQALLIADPLLQPQMYFLYSSVYKVHLQGIIN